MYLNSLVPCSVAAMRGDESLTNAGQPCTACVCVGGGAMG